MKNLKVSAKLITGFLLATLLSVIIGFVGIYGINTMNDVSDDMYLNKAKPLGDLATAMEYFQRIRVQVRNAILFEDDAEQLKSIDSDLNNRFSQFETSMNNYEPSLATEEGQRLFKELMNEYTTNFKPGITNIVNGAKAEQSATELVSQLDATTASATIIADNLSQLTQLRMSVMSDANDASNSQGGMLLIIIIAVIVVSTVISMILAVYISNLISKPARFMKDVLLRIGTKGDLEFSDAEYKQTEAYASVKDEIGESVDMMLTTVRRLVVVGKALESVAGGDLTTELNLLSERDTMGHSLQKMVASLNEMFGEINNATSQVATGSKQIADGSQALAQGSTEQAAAVEQLSSSISEIAEKTRENATMADKAATLANTIMGNAEKGSRQMNEMMAAVKDINDASQSINKVIKVIDDIAFQTNILALNAAVEAARAGQHGKGFAVVAEEVRNLAAKSAEAAKDTGSLIANSMEKAELGARIADETAASLVEIVSGINESTTLVSEIAKSSDEQSKGITQINKGIDQVAQVIQQNSATAEESAAASEEMSSQSDMLQGLVAQFKLKNSDGNFGRLSASHSTSRSQVSKQLTMPDKKIYIPTQSGGDFGKY